MSATSELIEQLVADIQPVRRLRAPLRRSIVWLVVAGVIFALLALIHGTRPDLADQLRSPRYATELAASLATGVLAAIGCFLDGLPDRSRLWLLLPLPCLLVWLATIGQSCLTGWIAIGPNGVQLGETARCFSTLLAVSMPLSALTFFTLRRVAIASGRDHTDWGTCLAATTSAHFVVPRPSMPR